MILLETEEYKKLISGKFQFRVCVDCQGKGWVWVDADAGEVVIAPDPKRPQEDFYRDCCEDCEGIGGFVIYD